MHSREAQISMQVNLLNLKLAETLISSRGRGERVSPCESSSIQDSSETMLIFHILSYISLVFNPSSQYWHMQNH